MMLKLEKCVPLGVPKCVVAENRQAVIVQPNTVELEDLAAVAVVSSDAAPDQLPEAWVDPACGRATWLDLLARKVGCCSTNCPAHEKTG